MKLKPTLKLRKRNLWIKIAAVILTVLLVVVIFTWLLFDYFQALNILNEFDNKIGIVNVVFTAFVFSFLAVTSIMQRNKIEEQKEEIKETIEELKHVVAAQKATEKAIDFQTNLMAKQAMLSSFQSMYKVSTGVLSEEKKGSDSKAAKTAREEIKRYKEEMERLIGEIKLDMQLYGNSMTYDKNAELKEIISSYVKEIVS